MDNTIKPIASTFKKGEWAFQQLERRGDVALFVKTKTVGTTHIASYEVIIIHVVPDTKVFGVQVPAHEKYPGNEQWGALAWTLATEADGRRKLEETIQGQVVTGKPNA